MIEELKKYWWIAALIVLAFVLSYYLSTRVPDIEGELMAGILGISYLGKSGEPRGIRNNNPGNLVKTSIPWKGKVPLSQNTDSRFEQFKAFWYGVRAMIKDISGDINKDGQNTIRKLITTYAPPSENHTETYIEYIANQTGWSPDRIIDSGNVDDMYKLVKAISKYENGKDVITREVFDYAYQNA